MQIIEAHKGFLRDVINDLSLEFHGGNSITSKTNPNIKSEADVSTLIERQLQIARMSTSATPLASYWRPLILEELLTKKMENVAVVKSNIKHLEGLSGVVEKLIVAITGSNKEVDVAVFKHFLWQIKRKLNGLPVTWHMMPIIWGKAGSGKSETLRKLFKPLKGFVHAGMALDKLGDDRYYRQLEEHFIVFLDEMPKIEKASIESIKHIITAQDLTGRVLYSNGHKSYQQNCTFIGTSNEAPSQLIKDSTNMRRFHYIKAVDKMDWDMVNSLDMFKVWQEVDEQRAEPYTADVFTKLSELQEDIRQKDAMELFITEGFLVKDANSMTKSQDIYEQFREFCKDGGFNFPPPKQTFNRQLIERFEFERVEGLQGVAARFPHFKAKLTKYRGNVTIKGN